MNKSVLWKTITIILFATIISIVFFKLNYIEKEGLNPTDEGVILAQSWRIINGEIAHKDFISIRPVGSGLLHSINFLIPGNIVVNARWFVLFQFFTIAVVISLLCFKFLSDKFKKIKIPIFLSLLISSFFLTVLNYNLYSWTTIDAIFWSVISIPFILKDKKPLYNVIGLILLCFSALSRQTFALICIAGFIYIVYQYRKSFWKSLYIFILGALPFIAYFIFLLVNSAMADFLQQMTGRTEFFETAIVQFVKRFVLSLTTPLNLVCLFVTVLLHLKKTSGLKELFIKKGFHAVFSIIYIVFSFALIFKYFFAQEQDIYSLPFELFFMLLFMGFFHYVLIPESKLLRKIILIILFISWVSAISLGDNTPVFATGILFIGLFTVCLDIVLTNTSKFSNIASNQWLILSLSLVIAISGFYSQQKFNYRDNPSDKLVKGLSYSSDEFGEILTNPTLIAYYSDLKDIFDSLPDAKNNIIVFPHNAIFYPVMKTQNPMSLDWLIANEYIGQEERIISDLEKLKDSDKIYFIVDKIDLRVIKDGIKPRFYNNDIIYMFIINNCQELQCNSEFVNIYLL